MQMVRQCIKACHEKAQQPLESHLSRTANPAKRDTFQQQALNEITRCIRDQVLLAAVDKVTATILALVVLFAVVDVAIFLIFGRLATRTDLSDDHTFRLTSVKWVSVLGQP